MFKLEKVYYKYHGEMGFALNGMSLSIPKGQWVAVIGTNGSGKSTFARQLNGLLLPLQGKVWVSGLDTAQEGNISLIRRYVAFVMQNPDNQIVASTVEEDTAFGPENLGLPSEEIRERVNEALVWVGIGHLKNKSPHLLSGGQKQRLAIAGALAMHTNCLVLDEPTSMLDPQGRREVLSTIARLHQEKKMNIVHITHSMEEAACAERIVVMSQGQVVMDGTPEEIFSQGEALAELGLELPAVTMLGNRLAEDGWETLRNQLKTDGLVEKLCLLK
ncbi:MAG: energy-coupling factor transporter ATPase [Peptococcaceae bacterium]|jgi:energy-coupling factor transport system ATP-binding protein|nr:energy-coupling factor transporter ATPase [Peptococcaceae bacterium]